MTGREAFKRAMRDVGRALQARGTHVNVSTRRNVVVQGNVGEPGSTSHASATQRTEIRQVNGQDVSPDSSGGEA